MPFAVDGLKECAVCKEIKPTAEYSNWAHSKDGLNSRCRPCARAENVRYRAIHHELVLAGKKAAYRRDPEANKAKSAEWKANNPDRHRYLVRRSWLKQIYNMTPEDYAGLLAAQGGTCALCPRAESPDGRQLSVDHDHNCCPGKRACGKCVRGLLCSQCNRLLGWFEARSESITSYLAAYQDARS